MKEVWRKHLIRIHAALWAAFVLDFINGISALFGFPGIDAELDPGVRYTVQLLWCSVPFFLFISGFSISRRKVRIISLFLAGALSCMSVLEAHWILKHGRAHYLEFHNDIYFDPVAEIRQPKSIIRVYRIQQGGSIGKFLIRQERRIPLGLVVVRNLGPQLYGEFSIDVKILDSETIELQNVYYRDMKYQPKFWLSTVKARPSWIFGTLVAAN